MTATANKGYRATLAAGFLSSFIQALTVNFIPLLYVSFQRDFGISLSRLSLLVGVNFAVQMSVDALAVKFGERIGMRRGLLIAHACSTLGLVCLALLPRLFSPFYALLLAEIVIAVGGGLVEVFANPVVESCPAKNKAGVLSFLHSCYCWGCIAVILIATLFFRFAGLGKWHFLALGFASIPACNFVLFCFVPIYPLAGGEKSMTARELFGNKTYLILVLLIFAAGAAEQSIAQWASAFAEEGLGISKATGDLLGPGVFALAMGLSRVLQSALGKFIRLETTVLAAGGLIAGGYLLAALAPHPALGFAGIALCGFAVGSLWPGVCSSSARRFPRGGAAMFAILSLAGDLGCFAGPTLVGFVSGAAHDSFSAGILAALVFPAVLVAFGALLLSRDRKARLGTLPTGGAYPVRESSPAEKTADGTERPTAAEADGAEEEKGAPPTGGAGGNE